MSHLHYALTLGKHSSLLAFVCLFVCLLNLSQWYFFPINWERKQETSMIERHMNWLPPAHPQLGQGSNLQPFGAWAHTLSTETHWLGHLLAYWVTIFPPPLERMPFRCRWEDCLPEDNRAFSILPISLIQTLIWETGIKAVTLLSLP